MNQKKTVVLLGKGSLSIEVGKWFLRNSDQYDLAYVVPTIPEPTWTNSLGQWATSENISVISSGHYKDLPPSINGNASIDLAFSVFYDKIIKSSFINRCDQILNLHNGPLPKYRGVSPINWALKNQETKHGVTIHEITPGIDDGPIISQVLFSIFPEKDEVVDVYQRALSFGLTLFEQTMPILDRIDPLQQTNEDATYYSSKENKFLGEFRHFTKHGNLTKMI